MLLNNHKTVNVCMLLAELHVPVLCQFFFIAPFTLTLYFFTVSPLSVMMLIIVILLFCMWSGSNSSTLIYGSELLFASLWIVFLELLILEWWDPRSAWLAILILPRYGVMPNWGCCIVVTYSSISTASVRLVYITYDIRKEMIIDL